ncbi:MAG: TonB C-terminal domain-containing protein [Deltaproteobacteria bacterium]|nr:TonB C-terminal domain-containing protein [Deltaproteobacteria bacterium]
MAAGCYNEEEQLSDFGFTIAISVFLHIVFIAFIFLLANDRSTIKITTSIYTVDLMSPGKTAVFPEARANGEALKKERPQTDVISKSVRQANDKDVSRPAVKEKAIALKKEKELSLDEAIKKIQKRVEKREAEEAVNKTIEELQNKQLEKKIKEIREKVVHRQVTVKPIKEKTEGVGKMQQGSAVKRIEKSEEKQGTGINTGTMQQGVAAKNIEELEKKYFKLVEEIITSKWNYTGDLKEGEVVVITVIIDKTGHLVKSYVEQSSANSILLQSAIRAIEKAALLFPSFPPELGKKDSLEIGVAFRRDENNQGYDID